GRLNESDASKISGRGKAGEVSHDAATQSQDGVGALEPVLDEPVVEMLGSRERLEAFAVSYRDFDNAESGAAQRTRDALAVEHLPRIVCDYGDSLRAAFERRARQLADLIEQSRADQDLVASDA